MRKCKKCKKGKGVMFWNVLFSSVCHDCYEVLTKEKYDTATRDKLIREARKNGFKALSADEHKKLVSGKKVVFSDSALKDAERLVGLTKSRTETIK